MNKEKYLRVCRRCMALFFSPLLFHFTLDAVFFFNLRIFYSARFTYTNKAEAYIYIPPLPPPCIEWMRTQHNHTKSHIRRSFFFPLAILDSFLSIY